MQSANIVYNATTNTVCPGVIKIPFLVMYGQLSNGNYFPMVDEEATGLVV